MITRKQERPRAVRQVLIITVNIRRKVSSGAGFLEGSTQGECRHPTDQNLGIA